MNSYTLKEWCERRKVSRSTAYRLIRAGQLETYKVRRRRYVADRSDRAFIESAKHDREPVE